MRLKSIISCVLSLAMLSSVVVLADGTDKEKVVDGREYVCLDLSDYANSISFDSAFDTTKKYTIPNYLGLGKDSNTQDLKHIYNKNAFDNKKDADGLIYDILGRPFNVSTSTTSKNTVLLGKGKYIGRTSVTIDVPEGRYNSFSFLSDCLLDVDAYCFEMTINYTDGTKTTDPNWVVAMRKSDPDDIFKFTGADAYIDFTTSATDPLGTGLLFRLEDADPTTPQRAAWKLAIFTLEADNTKTAKSITFKQTSEWRALDIFAITGAKYTLLDEVNTKVDSLPDPSDINFGNYSLYKQTVAEIQDALDTGITLSGDRATKYQAIAQKILDYDSNPTEGIKYLVDSLPTADEVNETNYQSYIQSLSTIADALSNGVTLDDAREQKYNALNNKVIILANKSKAEDLIKALPLPSEISKKNYTDYQGEISQIDDYLSNGVQVDQDLYDKFLGVKAAIDAVANEYNPYVTVDYSNSYNAILYANSDITLDDPLCRTPNFIGTMQNTASLQYYPTIILNKTAFNGYRNKDNLIYSSVNDVPFYIDTNGGVILGTSAKNKIHTIEIPVPQGVYESVSMATYSTWKLDPQYFEYKINYTDGTSTVDPDWLITAPGNNPAIFVDTCTDDYLSFIYDKNDPASTVSELYRNERIYEPNVRNVYTPIVTLKADKTKIVKSITASETDTWRAMAILGITCQLPSVAESKGIIEGTIDSINEGDILGSYSEIEVVKLMLSRYNSAFGAEAISNLEKFKRAEATFDNSVIAVTDAESFTDLETTTATFSLQNPIDTQNISKYISVTLNGEASNDYALRLIDNQTIQLIFNNDLNYDKTYCVTLLQGLPDKNHTGFSLQSDYKYTFKPIAPIEVSDFSLTDGKGNTTQLSNMANKSVTVSMCVKNNTLSNGNYAISVCMYDKNNRLTKIYLKQGSLSIGAINKLSYTFTPTDDASFIKCFVMDSYSSMNKIWQTIAQ